MQSLLQTFLTALALPCRRGAAVGATVALLLPVVLLSGCVNDDDDDTAAVSKVNVGDYIPAFTLADADGQELTSSSVRGRAYILNFFDTTCPDCQQELSVLQRIYDKYSTMVPVLNVPRSQTAQEVSAYWQHAGLTMPFYMPGDKTLYSKFATRGIPRTYVVDDGGKVVAAFSDSPIAAYESLDAILQQQLHDTVNLSFRVRIAKRSASDEYYFHNEYTISQLEVWFFDADTKQFFAKAVVKDLTQTDTPSNAEYDITYLYDDVRLRGGVYDIFCIANYDHSPDKVESEEEFLNMVDAVTYQQGIEANIPDKGPVMTNRATELLAVDLVPWINKDYVLTIDVERVIAKLQIGVSRNTFQLTHNDRKYADINITNYKLVNLNTKYYLFQHKDSLPQFSEQPTFTLPNHFGNYSDEGVQYVVDPLFYQKKPNAASAALVGGNYQSWFGAFTTSDFASMPSANNYGYAYILENTAFKTSQKNGYSPGIVFKAAVSPVFVYLYDAKEKSLKEEYRPEYWPNAIYLYKYNFYESIQAINMASGLALDELETYSDAQLKAYGIKQCKFNMGVYETYYTYWIHHRNSSAEPMGPMTYGIVRNNFYRIIVSGISGIGNSVITPAVMRDNYPNSYSDVIVDN